MNSSFVSLLQRIFASPRTLAAALLLSLAPILHGQATARTTFITSTSTALAETVDSGPVPSSQRLALTLTLAQTSDRSAALDQLLRDLTTSTAANYHKFLTPDQFAAGYGATADQLTAATAWASAQGFTVDSVSHSGTRIAVSAPASVVQSVFAVTLHNVQLNGTLYFANTTQPSLPASVAPLFTAIDGLSSLPTAPLAVQGSATTFSGLASLIDANSQAILTLDSSLTSATLTSSESAAYNLLLRQASAQGITLLATRPSLAGAFPAILAEVTAVALPNTIADTTLPTAGRPDWQIAPGLPADALRYAPDLTASSIAALAQTLSTIELQTGRQGNINRILYELGPTPRLYTQPDTVPAGTWEPATGLGLVDLNVLAKAFPRGTTAVEVDTTSSSYNPTHGSGFVLTSTVYPGAASTPTGSITWTSSNTAFTSTTIALNAGGVATSPTFQLPGGTYTITSTYSGDSTYAAGTTTTTLTVNPETANFTVSAPATASLGGTVAVTATVTEPSGIGVPSGTITASLTGASNQTGYITGTGTAGSASTTLTFNVNQAGTLTVQATCTPGDTSYTCYNTATASVAVPKATPTLALSLSNANPTTGASITFTTKLTGVTGVTPTGNIAIFDNGAQIGTITLPATTYTGPLGSGSTHSVTAQYNGDGNYNTATSPAQSASTGLAPTTVTATAYPASFVYGQNTTVVIAVAPASGTQVNGTAPGGSVTVTAGTATPVTQTFGGGNVNVTLNGLTVGTYTVQIAYSGDSNYAASSNSTVSLTVTPFAATITPQLSGTTFTQGSTQTLTVQFASATNAPVPQNAAFTATLDGVVYTKTFSINAGGVNATGQVTINAPPAGTWPLQVNCVANTLFTCNTPAPITVTSTATTTTPPPGSGTSPTQTVLTASSLSPAAGASITLTATVTGLPAIVAVSGITGSVTFLDGATVLTSAPVALVNGSYIATAPVTLTGTTAHALTAVYSGDTVFASSTSAAITVNSSASPAAITLTSTSTTGAAGQAISFTALVTGSTNTGAVPTGSVTFYLAGTTPSALATIGLGYQGPGVSVAVYTTTGLPAGAQTIYAVYSGDGNFLSVTSNSITTGLTDFSATFSPSSISLVAGQSGTSTLNVSLLGAFSGTVALTCTSPVDSFISCSFSPSTLTASGSSVLSVTTTAGNKAFLTPPPALHGATEALGAVSFAALLCLLLPGRSRRRVPTLLLALLALSLTANLGCGSNGTSKSLTATSGTPLGTSILTITAAGTQGSTTIRHTYSFQVTVQ